ncbi:MAG: type I restriction endonuclease [Candidatus Hatepunaea meridiana]|nr:type I restriction endonuclease [Candidatus Hatepunaea meridiana]
MDFIDELRDHRSHALKQIEHLSTEEATKTSLINPFIRLLGYSVMDVTEVQPEFCAGPGTKKEEKVDYAILQDGKPIMIIECKSCGEDLNKHYNQLCGYFAFTKARVGILTNGIEYRFYSDLDELNKMDRRHFLMFNILEHFENKNLVDELKRFTKTAFDVDEMKIKASALKYSNEIKRIIREELEDPTNKFVGFFLQTVMPGRVKTKKLRDDFRDILKKALNEFIEDRIRERFIAFTQESPKAEEDIPKESEKEEEEEHDSGIVTTVEEWTALGIIKSILHNVVELDRITLKDRKTICNILLDNKSNKRLLVLYMNDPSNMIIGLIDENNKPSEEIKISKVDEIFKYSDRIVNRAKFLIIK